MSGSIRPGVVLDGTYRIVRSVGVGGMGEVYEARHARLAGRYAVKVLHPDVQQHQDVLQRFKREARITSALRHPGIVQVIDFNTTPDGAPYLVMEYLEGEDLAQLLAREGHLPLKRVARITSQIAGALAAAHRRGVVHRDLKPQNIFLVPSDDEEEPERAKVLDFGISKIRSVSQKLTGAQVVMGTPQFMAPEQAEGKEDLDAAVDQFALGAIVYEMLTGRAAFTGETLATVIYKIVHKDPLPLRRFRPELPASVEQVLSIALAKDRARRFLSVTDFARRLRAAAGDPVAAAESGSLDSTAPGIERGGEGARARRPSQSGSTLAYGPASSETAASTAEAVGQAAHLGAAHAGAEAVGSPGRSRPSRSRSGPALSPPEAAASVVDRRTTTLRRLTGELLRWRAVVGTRAGKLAIGGGAVAVIAVVVLVVAAARSSRTGARSASTAAAASPSAGSSVSANDATAGGVPNGIPAGRPTAAPVVAPIAPPAESAPATSDAPAAVAFELASEPSGVPVWIDGKPFPSADQQAITWARGELLTGAHKIELTKPGYHPWRRTVEIKAGRPNRFLARLQKEDPGEIFAQLRPATAPPGAAAAAPSRVPSARDLGPPSPAASAGPCSMTVGSVPWTELWVDGTNTHRHTPVASFLAPCGPHRIELRRRDLHIDLATQVDLVAGRNAKLIYHFDGAGQVIPPPR